MPITCSLCMQSHRKWQSAPNTCQSHYSPTENKKKNRAVDWISVTSVLFHKDIVTFGDGRAGLCMDYVSVSFRLSFLDASDDKTFAMATRFSSATDFSLTVCAGRRLKRLWRGKWGGWDPPLEKLKIGHSTVNESPGLAVCGWRWDFVIYRDVAKVNAQF